MKRGDYPGLVALALIGAFGPSGCADPKAEVGRHPAPPPPPPRAEADRTYDYTHSIQQDGVGVLNRKLVVALVRFQEDRPVEDVPFGPGPEIVPVEGSDNVVVDVQVGGVRTAGEPKQPLSMNRRAREILKHELMESESFVLVERERILDILREQRFGQTRYVNPATSAEIGEVMSVQYLLEGSIGLNEDRTLKDALDPPPTYKDGGPSLAERIFNPTMAANRARLHELAEQRRRYLSQKMMRDENPIGTYLSLYDVRTSQVVVEAFGIGGNGLESIADAVEDLVDKCRDIPNPVRIAAVDQDRVFLDIGMQDRVSVGQRFRYFTPGPVVRNNAGQVIGTQDEEGGEVEITRVDELMSVAKVVRRVDAPVVGARVEPLD